MNVEDYFWTCPRCGERVDAIRQLATGCFDEDGEAEFDPERGLTVHTICCPNCGAKWYTSVSEMDG